MENRASKLAAQLVVLLVLSNNVHAAPACPFFKPEPAETQTSESRLRSKKQIPFDAANAVEQAQRLYRVLNGGAVLRPDAQEIQDMSKLIATGDLLGAADIATKQSGFYNVTVKQFASIMSARDEKPNHGLNDFEAIVIGMTAAGADARSMLSGNFTYTSSRYSTDYKSADQSGDNLGETLMKKDPQNASIPDAAGLLTSQTWGKEHLVAGTNRRAVEYTFREFLCRPIADWRDTKAPDVRIRRDIDRLPGGDPLTFQNECRGCHAPMDAMGGAFAHFDFTNEQLNYNANSIVSKMNHHSDVYSEGYVTLDDSWINYASMNHNESFGWHGTLQGKGVKAFGEMISNADQFRSCMATRAFTQVCRHKPLGDKDQAKIQALAKSFGEDQYNLKKLFARVALTEGCDDSAKRVNSIKTGLEYFNALSKATGVPTYSSTIQATYQKVGTRLPVNGLPSEISNPMMYAAGSLAGAYCSEAIKQEFPGTNGTSQGRLFKGVNNTLVNGLTTPEQIKANPTLGNSKEERQKLTNTLASAFWGRLPTAAESARFEEFYADVLKDYADNGNGYTDLLLATCTQFATSLEFLFY